eukprot:12281950-Ditylum_brightwellii.AAC.1
MEMHDLIGQKYGIGQVNSHITGCKQMRGGILPFHAVIISDHRCMYVDINWKLLFIGKTHAPADHPQ